MKRRGFLTSAVLSAPQLAAGAGKRESGCAKWYQDDSVCIRNLNS